MILLPSEAAMIKVNTRKNFILTIFLKVMYIRKLTRDIYEEK